LKCIGDIHRPSRIPPCAASTPRTASNSLSGKRSGKPVVAWRGSGQSGESGHQSPEAACQPSSSTNVSIPIRCASSAWRAVSARSMSSFAPVEIRFASTPFELNTTSPTRQRDHAWRER
jgi:hypothetical protein